VTSFTAAIRTVYFARPVGQIEPIKIGCTRAVERRMQQLRCEVRSELEVVAAIPGSMDDERRIQSLCWHDRIRGEWFKHSLVLELLMEAAARGELDIESLPAARVRAMPEKNYWRERAKLAAQPA
jgi:hypothetical protein